MNVASIFNLYNLYDESDEGWTERGCTLDNNENVEKFATLCNETRCNRENAIHSHCIHCESHAKGLCSVISDPNSLSQQCTGIYSFEDRGCFTMNKSISFSAIDCFDMKLMNPFFGWFFR